MYSDPGAVMNWLSALPSGRETCLECGAGTAEISAFMVSQYSSVTALDADQRHMKILKKPVQGVCATADALPFADNTMDLVISMQALHHFDVDKHLAESHRVLRDGGVFAALCWGEIHLPADVASAYSSVFEALQPCWEDARQWLVRGYEGLKFEGAEITLPPARMTRLLCLDDLDLTIATWSSARKAHKDGVRIPDPKITSRQKRLQNRFPVSWPLLGKVFRV